MTEAVLCLICRFVIEKTLIFSDLNKTLCSWFFGSSKTSRVRQNVEQKRFILPVQYQHLKPEQVSRLYCVFRGLHSFLFIWRDPLVTLNHLWPSLKNTCCFLIGILEPKTVIMSYQVSYQCLPLMAEAQQPAAGIFYSHPWLEMCLIPEKNVRAVGQGSLKCLLENWSSFRKQKTRKQLYMILSRWSVVDIYT